MELLQKFYKFVQLNFINSKSTIMLPVTFPGWNVDFKPPEGWTDEQCDTVPGKKYTDNNIPCCLLLLKPNLEDLNAINRDKLFYYKICTCVMPPFVFFIHEEQLPTRFVEIGEDVDNVPYCLFEVLVNDAAIKNMNAGYYVAYKAIGESIIPFATFTVDENKKGNF